MIVARWQTKGKDFIELHKENDHYFYKGNGCSGSLPKMTDDNAAIAYMERPWGYQGGGPVTILKSCRSSLKRV